MQKKFLITIFISAILLLGGCVPFVSSIQLQPGVGETQAAHTMVAVLTQSALSTLQAQVTTPTPPVEEQPQPVQDDKRPDVQQPPMSKDIITCITATPQVPVCPTATSDVPASVVTPTPPTTNPTTTATSSPVNPTATPTTSGTAGSFCNAAKFIKDITVPDNTIFMPNAKFTKIWRLQNVGTCTWTTDYKVVYDSGNQMEGPAEVNLPKTVSPGETADIAVDLYAPGWPGNYIGYWKLKSGSGSTFGIGSKASSVFYVKIISDRTTVNTLVFTDVFCSAQWTSSTGSRPCPSPSSLSYGSVTRVLDLTMEGGAWKEVPALITIPSDGSGGYLSGRFPAYQVLPGDHLKTTIGCLEDYPKCDLSFKVSYVDTDGVTRTLFGPKGQTRDAWVDTVDIDLNTLQNTAVEFILTVTNNGTSSDDFGFWLNPIVVRAR